MNKSTPNVAPIAPRRPPVTRRTLIAHVVGETTEEVQNAMNDLVNALVRHARAHV